MIKSKSDMTETERLLWNLVSGIRALVDADAERSSAANLRALLQTDSAVKELAAALNGSNRRIKNPPTRTWIKNPPTGTWTKRDDKSGKFMDVKEDPKPFKGVRKKGKRRSKSGVILERNAKQYADSMRRIAKR